MAPGHHRCWHRCSSSRQAALHFFSIADRNLENRLALLLPGELFASRIGFDMYLHVCAGCMAALQAEHFLQVHGAAEEEAAKVPAENGIAKALENGAKMENGAVHQNGGSVKEANPQLVAVL